MLSNSTGGLVLSSRSTVEVLIMANDNPYGRFKFDDASLLRSTVEENYDTVIMFEVTREFGSHGDVILDYEVSQVDDGITHGILQNDVYPRRGSLRFTSRETNKTFSLFIKGDLIPELEEKFEIRYEKHIASNRSSRPEMFCKKGVLKISQNSEASGLQLY